MSRNSEVLFSSLPSINIQRSVMDIPFDHKTTFNCSELIPFYVAECLPGDSVKIQTNKVIRTQTLLTPLMDSLYLDTFYFYIPNRLVWNHWKEFMGENTTSAYLPDVEYRPPRINFGGDDTVLTDPGVIKPGEIPDYLGIPPYFTDDVGTQGNNWFLAFYLRAYWLVWNEFFRDQNLDDPINIPLGDNDVNWRSVSDTLKKPLKVNKFHDYFTSCLKAPAKVDGGFVSAPVSSNGEDSLPVVATKTPHNVTTYALHGTILGESNYSGNYSLIGTSSGTGNAEFISSTNPGLAGYAPDNLYASLSTLGVSIPDLRMAFQMQKFFEREASHGTRYQEVLLSHFQTRALDSRLQRPEYLGGNRIPLNVSQVVNNAQSDGEFLGDLGGMSLTTDSHFDVEFSSQEHGILMGLCCVRYKHSYSQGIDRFFHRSTKFDYFWPEFARLTDSPVYNYEVYNQTFVLPEWNPDDVFGYQERYAEYKFRNNKCSGEMRPGVDNSLASWHLGDLYSDPVYLSADWLKEDKTPVDRALAVTSSVSNQFFGDFYVQARWTRPMPIHSDPGLADHF